MGKIARLGVVLGSAVALVFVGGYFGVFQRLSQYIKEPTPPIEGVNPPTVIIEEPDEGERFNAQSVHIIGHATPNTISNKPIDRIRVLVYKSGAVVYNTTLKPDGGGFFQTSTPQQPNGEYMARVIVWDIENKSKTATVKYVLSYFTVIPPPSTRIDQKVIESQMANDNRLKGLILSIRIMTDINTLSFFTGCYRQEGGTGFTDIQLKCVEQEAFDRIAELGLTRRQCSELWI